MGVLVSVLAGAGASIGSGPHLLARNDRHPAALWPVLVGDTSKGGKGTAWSAAAAAHAGADPAFFAHARQGRVRGGLGSGEALIDEVKDPDGDAAGADDRRLLVLERELARVLRVGQRDGSIMSMTLRDAWDGHRLEARSRGRESVVASGYHLVVGHVTREKLASAVTTTETFNGWANRFLWVAVRRSKRLPEGGNVPSDLAAEYGRAIGAAIMRARTRGEMHRTPAARVRWAEVHDELADDDPGGILGAVTARAEPMCARLSLPYALLDQAPAIDVAHVEAARALWRYSRHTAERIWSDALGDPDADRLLGAIRSAGAAGLDGTGQRDALGRHGSAPAARNRLEELGPVVTRQVDTGGRPTTVTIAAEHSDQSDESDRR